MLSTTQYDISTERDITEILEHFDSEYIIAAMQDKLENIDFASTLIQANIVASFEENFKLMKEQFIGDEININIVRDRVYRQIIDILWLPMKRQRMSILKTQQRPTLLSEHSMPLLTTRQKSTWEPHCTMLFSSVP